MSRALHTHRGVVTEWEADPPPEVTHVQEPPIPEVQEEQQTMKSDEPLNETSSASTFAQSSTGELVSAESPLIAEIIPQKLIFKSSREKWIFFAFIIPPLAISFISMLHMISLFETSNMYWMAMSIAIAVELAAMSSLVALVTLDRLNKTTIWSIFGVLACLQVLGNMYHTFVNMSPEAAQTILNLLAIDNTPWSIRLVNFIVGGILPVISLTFVKGIVDYFKE